MPTLPSSISIGPRWFLAVLLLAGGIWIRLDAQSVRHIIRDRDGTAACVVAIPDARSAKPDDDRVGLDVRVPATPVSTLLGKLPANKRDYSGLPIQVTLIPTPAKGDRSLSTLPRRVPLTADYSLRRLGINATAEGDTFIHVEFTRADLKGGVDVVAERTAVADSGEKVTSQTRCRIGTVDAIVWR